MYLYYIIGWITSIRAVLYSCLLTYITSTTPLNAGEIRLPSLGGDYSTSILSPEQAELLGESFMRSLRNQVTFSDEPSVQYYIKSLGEQLAAQSDIPAQDFEFFVIDNPTLNAFAGPDGKIGIHTGLIEKTESEGELAAVLAHEIAHVSQRHLMRQLESQQDLSLPTIATVLATVVAASADPQAGQAVAATATGLSLQRQINFTRSNEQEADRVGMQILYDAGYDPANMPAFFGRLQQANRYSGDNVPEYLSTHPLTLSRISDAESRAAQFPQQQKGNEDEFHRIRQILLIDRFKNAQRAVRHYKILLQKADTPNIRKYLQFGHGIALLKAGQSTEAVKQLLVLLQTNPDNPTLATTIAYAYMEDGNRDAALKIIRDVHLLYPSHLPLTLLHADLLVSSGRSDQAVRLLEQRINTATEVPELYNKLSAAYGSANQPVKSHISQAHYHFLLGETKKAISQLDYAERTARDGRGNFIIFSAIDARRLLYEEKEKSEKEQEF